MSLLIEKGADLQAKSLLGRTVLMYAYKYPKIMKQLLKHKMDIDLDAQDVDGKTVLMLSGYASLETMKLLLDAGADPNVVDNKGWTVLMQVAYYGHYKMANLLLKKGANLYIEAHLKETALKLASSKGHTKIVNLLNYHIQKDKKNEKNNPI